MAAEEWEVSKLARARVVADEYARASEALALLKAECEDEKRVLCKMKKAAKVVAVSLTVVYIALLVVGCIIMSTKYHIVAVLGSFLIMLVQIVFPVLLFAFIPAGFIGMWRAIRRSGWIVWGGPLVMMVILAVLFAIPMFGGIFFYLGQAQRVKKLEMKVADAEYCYERASKALS